MTDFSPLHAARRGNQTNKQESRRIGGSRTHPLNPRAGGRECPPSFAAAAASAVLREQSSIPPPTLLCRKATSTANQERKELSAASIFGLRLTAAKSENNVVSMENTAATARHIGALAAAPAQSAAAGAVSGGGTIVSEERESAEQGRYQAHAGTHNRRV